MAEFWPLGKVSLSAFILCAAKLAIAEPFELARPSTNASTFVVRRGFPRQALSSEVDR